MPPTHQDGPVLEAEATAAAAPGGVSVVARGLDHRYTTTGRVLQVLAELDLEVPAGGYLTVTGPSGAGKSTLLAVLGGLEAPQRGSVRVGETELAGLRGDDLARYRRTTVGFVFQHFGLLETLTAAENVELAGCLSGGRPAVRRARAAELLDAVGLGDRADHRPLQLSGGERQRVAIARSIVHRPRLLLADEPTGNLDEDSADTVIELLESLHRSLGCTLVIVTHNHRLAARGAQHLELTMAGR